MSATAAAALVLSATVAIQIENAEGVSDAELETITATLASAIEHRTGERPRIAPRGCPGGGLERCEDAVREATGATEIVFVTLLGVPTRIRFVADRTSTDSAKVRHAEIDLERSPDTWPAAFEGVAALLFPEATPPPVATQLAPAPVTAPGPPPAEASPLPWIILGASAAAAIGGAIAGVTSLSARREVETTPLESDGEQRRLSRIAVQNAWLANGLFVLTAAGVTTAAVMLFD